jgi:hypothetical protein
MDWYDLEHMGSVRYLIGRILEQAITTTNTLFNEFVNRSLIESWERRIC